MRGFLAPFILALTLGLSFSERATTENVAAAGARSLLGQASGGSGGQLSTEDLVIVYPTHSRRLKLVHATRAARQGVRTVIVVENSTVAAALNAQPDAAKHRETYVPWGDATDGEGRPVVGHALLRGGPRWAMAPLQAHHITLVAAAKQAGRSAADATSQLTGARQEVQGSQAGNIEIWKADIVGGSLNPDKAVKPSEAKLPYRWMLLARDDTLWLPSNTIRLLSAYNDSYAVAVADNIYDFSGKRLLLPSVLAAVCLPCHADLTTLLGRKHPPGVPQPACPICRPAVGCEFRFDACGGFTGGGDEEDNASAAVVAEAVARASGRAALAAGGEAEDITSPGGGALSTAAYTAGLGRLPCGSKQFMGSGDRCTHSTVVGGAGLALSSTLLSYLDKERWLDCVRDVQPSTGERSLSRCLWRNGFAYTHPAAGLLTGLTKDVFSEQHMLFGSPLARKVLAPEADSVLSGLRTAALNPATGTAKGANGSVVARAAAAATAAGAQAVLAAAVAGAGADRMGRLGVPAAAALMASQSTTVISATVAAKCANGGDGKDCDVWAAGNAVSIHLGVPPELGLESNANEQHIAEVAVMMEKVAARIRERG